MRAAFARPRWLVESRWLRTLHTPSETPRWDLGRDADDKNASPTLEALDFLRPAAHRHKRTDTPTAVWTRTYNRINDSFTRPQLYQLARDAKLEDVRASMPKAQLVKAFMEQRFELRDPDAPIDAKSTFLPLPISDVFLLSYESRSFFDILRRTQVNASMDKRDLQTGVTITGNPRAAEQVRAWLNHFQQSIQTMRLHLEAPDELLIWISYRTQCHVAKEGPEICLRYLKQEQADQARMLLEEQSHTLSIEAPDTWLLSPYEAGETPFLSSLPYSPGTAAEPLSCYALRKGAWSRLVGNELEAPLHLVPLSQTTTEFPEHLSEKISSKTNCVSNSLVDGEWTQNTHTSFGHLLWDQAPADLSTIPSLESPGLFLTTSPPSCLEHSPTLARWTELEFDEQELECYYYRMALDHGAVDLVLTLGIQGAPVWQSATWMCHADAHVLCPTLPVDMRVTLSKEAPLRLSALDGTPLASYLDHVSRCRAAESGTSAFEALEQGDISQPTLPLHVQLFTPEGAVSLHLWRTERMTQRTSTYYHPEHTGQLTLHRRTRRCNSMSSFCATVTLSMPTWPGVETVQSLLQSPYPALGRQR
ncbi:Uncharacterized protein MSYG_0449 [Malassezia sympodialis ATCC 42132]|uniref:Uncharacterized protein n=1 Tax=Malassezia sympodialis (strain ATCC 42132) TaxID=1230383 RepID=A0A1M8A1P4_MALS4|nr:Uncharacterized protein MSYG_0449 [Malassezia sympodialis ATCC 42132]